MLLYRIVQTFLKSPLNDGDRGSLSNVRTL